MTLLDLPALAPYPPADTPTGACVRNVLAKLATVPADHPLLDLCEEVLVMQAERIWVQVDTALVSRLEAYSQGEDAVFAKEGRPMSSAHRHLLDWLAMTHPEASFTLVSFRERVTFNSLQVVVAVNSRPGRDYADCDIDLGGALTDVVGFVRHQAELTRGGVTDHLLVRAAFLMDPVLGPLVA